MSPCLRITCLPPVGRGRRTFRVRIERSCLGLSCH
ncbi:hypothetical protein E2C01_100239 [Portunus trituberculatus]|uniref:Uncharacterized protein n=1 Tax=Portunus trituberculatus TaxID=210409 RepID=A0A5B7KIX3_PORTR|nr:hypothetical protein [Portunus trituberculatus]